MHSAWSFASQTPRVHSVSDAKLAPGCALIWVNFDPMQKIGPKVGGGRSFEGRCSFVRLCEWGCTASIFHSPKPTSMACIYVREYVYNACARQTVYTCGKLLSNFATNDVSSPTHFSWKQFALLSSMHNWFPCCLLWIPKQRGCSVHLHFTLGRGESLGTRLYTPLSTAHTSPSPSSKCITPSSIFFSSFLLSLLDIHKHYETLIVNFTWIISTRSATRPHTHTDAFGSCAPATFGEDLSCSGLIESSTKLTPSASWWKSKSQETVVSVSLVLVTWPVAMLHLALFLPRFSCLLHVEIALRVCCNEDMLWMHGDKD